MIIAHETSFKRFILLGISLIESIFEFVKLFLKATDRLSHNINHILGNVNIFKLKMTSA